MSDPIFISQLKGIEQLIARFCDDGDGKLEEKNSKGVNEISLFNTELEAYRSGKQKVSIFENKEVAPRDATYVAPKFVPQPVRAKNADAKESAENLKIRSWIETEVKKKGGDISKVDLPYWADRIERVAKTYNFPPELLTAIVAKESGFEKNINSKSGKGPMGVTGIACRAFFPGVKGNWHDIYKQMNEPLLNDVLYKKDSNGNFVKDAKGNYVLKYKTPEQLRDACAKDDELGMKVGLLSFEMNYVSAFARKYYNGPTWKTVPKAIDVIKTGQMKLNEKDNQKLVETALKNYNSVFSSYAPSVIDSLKRHGVRFEEFEIISNAKG